MFSFFPSGSANCALFFESKKCLIKKISTKLIKTSLPFPLVNTKRKTTTTSTKKKKLSFKYNSTPNTIF